MTVDGQVQALIDAGVARAAGISDDEFVALAADLPDADDGDIVAINPLLAPPSVLAPLLRRSGKSGFVVVDMTDVDEFAPVVDVEMPDRPLYLVRSVDRGDDLRGWTPNDADPELRGRGRSPLTLNEGISWLLLQPDRLEPNHCFMTAGSRLVRNGKLDTRVPAIWISGGTGRDTSANRNAPKVGWCWAGNFHTWLGFASCTSREAKPVRR